MDDQSNNAPFVGTENQIDHATTPPSQEAVDPPCPDPTPIDTPKADTLEFHPLANVFPLLEGEKFDRLVEDIKENGQRATIVKTPDNRVLDGRNRYLACLEAGVEPKFETTQEPPEKWLDFVISKNVHRRQLTESQRALAAAKLVTTTHGDNRHTLRAEAVPVITQPQAAARFGVSDRLVRDALKVMEESPELHQLVKDGKAPVTLAAGVVRNSPKHVAEFIEEVKAGKTPANAKRKIEAAKESAQVDDSVAVKEPDAGAASPRLEDEHDQLVYIGIESMGEGAAVIDGRSYVFNFTRPMGAKPFIDVPRPLETDEFCRTIVKPRALKLVQETLKKRDDVKKNLLREWEAERDRALGESRAQANVQVVDCVDTILALVKDRGVRPFYMGHAWINGERFNFNYAPKTNTVTAFREVDGDSWLEDQEVEEAAAPRIRKLLTPKALKNAVPMRERDDT